MKLLDILTHAADEEQLRLNPLPEHAAAGQDEHLRRHYALLLVAVLTAQPNLSEAQTRLLRLLLESLKLGDIRGELFEQARALEEAQLVEAARLIREAGLVEHLIVDALVLLRLDQPLSDEASRLVGELAALLGLDQAALTACAENAANILGLGDEAQEEDPDADSPVPSPLTGIWPSALRRPLTVEALRQGLEGGVWVLDADLVVDFPWRAEGAVLLFRNGATLSTAASAGDLTLTGCRLWNARLVVLRSVAVNLERCDWSGRYDPAAQATALKVRGEGARLTVRESQFQTRNARAILAEDHPLDIQHSRFDHCGHPSLDGGALWHSARDDRTPARMIAHCHFHHCQAAHGGALGVEWLYGVAHCTFVACTSEALQRQGGGNIAVYAEKAKAPTAIEGCAFRDTSLYIGNARDGGGNVWDGRNVLFVRACQFIHSDVYYHNRYYSNRITSDCSFEGGNVIEKEFK